MFESCIFALMAQLAHRIISYVKYLLKAKNEHAFHSPFVFDFTTKVLYTKKDFYAFEVLEKKRLQLQNNHSTIEIEELGAKQKGHYEKKIADIANQAVLPKKYAQLLFKCIDYFQPQSVLELGTNLGLTTAYLAMAHSNIKVTSIEGNASLSQFAKNEHSQLKIQNIKIINALFDDVLPDLNRQNDYDFVFIDGNHTKTATLQYFNILKTKAKQNNIIIFDDIYWSKGMTEAWELIKKDSAIGITIDLYKFGMVFFKDDIVKQDFVIRF
jgi:predicted O-methyltransferase YrrM